MDSTVLDAHWREALKDEGRFSVGWYQRHPITRELLYSSDVLKAGGYVIEFGCGIGIRAYIAWGNSFPLDITGVDGSPLAIRHAKTRYERESLRFECADLLDLPYYDNKFDNGYMLAVIEHIQDTGKLLSECARVIKPGGKLFVSVTENDYHGDPSHVHVFNHLKLLDELMKSGFGTMDCYVTDHIVYATAEVA